MAVMLATKVVKNAAGNFCISFNWIYCWCDNQIAMFWIKKDPQNFSPFIRNRVEKIQKKSFAMQLCMHQQKFSQNIQQECYPWKDAHDCLHATQNSGLNTRFT